MELVLYSGDEVGHLVEETSHFDAIDLEEIGNIWEIVCKLEVYGLIEGNIE